MVKNYSEFRTKLLQKINKNRKKLGVHDEYIFKHLNSESLCIDLGANVGKVTTKLRTYGSEVICFEPHPGASKQLKNKFQTDTKVRILDAAASDRNGTAKLFLHKDSIDTNDYGAFSESSSLVSTKVNVSTNSYVNITEIDIGEFVNTLPKRVNFMKIDVEGYEVGLLWRLISSGAIHKIDNIYVETHEEKVPWLFWKLLFLKTYLNVNGIKNVNFNWT